MSIMCQHLVVFSILSKRDWLLEAKFALTFVFVKIVNKKAENFPLLCVSHLQ